ncbi:hypothetical protein [Magnetospirillum aberrantis]|uniref:Uncharacterized protein n=1 Tax=Magnetospirillum aberrantis SpK TaxID=908842 RepID=A0A7C9QT20_9PROT|nr:hypothetical protein [Magnetospirillum aberrantis]NFV78776.1 hypothetical protein [Magnetospirillum aberrantis SpK]
MAFGEDTVDAVSDKAGDVVGDLIAKQLESRRDERKVMAGSPRRPGGRDPGSFDPPGTFPMPKPQPPSNGSNLPGGELTQQQQLEALIRIMNGGKTPEAVAQRNFWNCPKNLPPKTRQR